MSNNRTTTDLLSSIKSRALIPDNQNTYSDSDLLSLADDEIETGLVPLILSTREQYFLYTKDYAINGAQYDIPERAIGQRLSGVFLKDDDGRRYEVPWLDFTESDRSHYFGFYLQGNKIVFTDTPNSTPQAFYFIRPGKLIKPSEAGKVVSISGTDVEVGTVPSGFTTGEEVDFIKANPGYDRLALDEAISSVSGSTLSFSSVPSDLAVGDYIALAGKSPVIQLPPELIPVLAQRVAIKVMEGLGNYDGMTTAQQKLSIMESNVTDLLENRVSSNPKKIVNYNSRLRTGKGSYGGRGWI